MHECMHSLGDSQMTPSGRDYSLWDLQTTLSNCVYSLGDLQMTLLLEQRVGQGHVLAPKGIETVRPGYLEGTKGGIFDLLSFLPNSRTATTTHYSDEAEYTHLSHSLHTKTPLTVGHGMHGGRGGRGSHANNLLTSFLRNMTPSRPPSMAPLSLLSSSPLLLLVSSSSAFFFICFIQLQQHLQMMQRHLSIDCCSPTAYLEQKRGGVAPPSSEWSDALHIIHSFANTYSNTTYTHGYML